MLQNFFLLNQQPIIVETGTYIPLLVLISYIVAVLSSYTVLDFTAHISHTKDTKKQNIWQYGGAFIMGAGIWSMHFIGMLAYDMDMVIEYDYALTILSMIPAILVAYFVLDIIKKTKKEIKIKHVLLSALLLGIGISTMHYTGMEAMKMDGDIYYKPVLFILSILIAIGASAAALIISFIVTYRIKKNVFLFKSIAALIMGLAICGMHYTGMAATIFVPWADCRYDPDQSYFTMALAISVTIFAILILALLLRIQAYSSDHDHDNQATTISLNNPIISASIFFILGISLSVFSGYFAHGLHTKELKSGYNKKADLFTIDFENTIKSHIENINSIENLYKASPDLDSSGFQIFAKPIIKKHDEINAIHFTLKQLETPKNNNEKISNIIKLYKIKKDNIALPYIDISPDFIKEMDNISTKENDILIKKFQKTENNINEIFTLNKKIKNDKKSKNKTYGYITLSLKQDDILSKILHSKEIYKDMNVSIDTQKNEPNDQTIFHAIKKEIKVKNEIWILFFKFKKTQNLIDKWETYLFISLGGIFSLMLSSYAFIALKQRKKHFLLNKELSQEKAQLDTILNTTAEGIFAIDINGYTTLANEAAQKMTGYSLEELKNKPQHELLHHSLPDGSPCPIQESYIYKTIYEGTKSQSEKEVFWRKNSTFFPVSYNSAPIISEHGDIKGAVISFNDITERKMKERLLHHAIEEADKANTTKSDFLANMSHELRTPLNSILGITRMIAEDPELSEDNKNMTEILLKSSTNLLEIVNDILDISKIESGNMVLERIEFDLKDTIKNILETMAPIASAKGITLSCQYAHHDLPYIIGDPFRINRILTNLISNAIKYTNKETKEKIVSLSLKTVLNKNKTIQILFTVEDNGIGISEDKISSVFEKFIQADASTTRQFGGTGLGLAITKELVELMRGTIGVESKVGKGSRFWFNINFDIADEQSQELTKELTKERRKSRRTAKENLIYAHSARVLVAEDHLLNQDFITRLLKRLGFKHIDIVENGALAIESFKDNTYNIILMDCHMPEKNGYEATSEIRQSDIKNSKSIPIVALTADAMKGTKERCMDIGMNGYVDKPIDADILKETLSEWIDFSDQEAQDTNSRKETTKTVLPVDISLLEEYAETPDDIKNFIKIFITQSDESIEALIQNCTNDNNKNWVESAHKFKGGAGMIGAKALHQLCSRAQEMNPATKQEREEILDQIKIEYNNVKKYLENL